MPYTLELLGERISKTRSECVPGPDALNGDVWAQSRAEQYVDERQRITVISDDQVYFLTDDHLFGHGLLPQEFVPCSYTFPLFNMNRFKGPADDMIRNLSQLLDVHYSEKRPIHSLQELVDYLNGDKR